MRSIDLSSWDSIVSALVGIALFAIIGVGIRLLMMMTIQQRRERLNRQINERLRTLIAAYKVLGGSFTGSLIVDPTHLKDLRARMQEDEADSDALTASDRPRRIRDAVEAALSDIILLGTEDQVRLAAKAATELAAGRPVPTDDLVISLRNFIREALDLDPIPTGIAIPKQGPARPAPGGGGGGKGGGGREEGRQGGGGGGGAGGMGGMGAGMGMGLGAGTGVGAGLRGLGAEAQENG